MSKKPATTRKRLSQQVTMPRDEAEQLYPQLLRRDADPQPGDEAMLHRMLAAVGLTTADYAADVDALQEAERLQSILEGESDLDARRAEAVAEFERVDNHVREETEKLQAKLIAARQAVSQVGVDAIPINKAREQLRNLRQKHRLAFGLPEPTREQSRGVVTKMGRIRSDEEREAAGDAGPKLMFNTSPTMRTPAL